MYKNSSKNFPSREPYLTSRDLFLKPYELLYHPNVDLNSTIHCKNSILQKETDLPLVSQPIRESFSISASNLPPSPNTNPNYTRLDVLTSHSTPLFQIPYSTFPNILSLAPSLFHKRISSRHYRTVFRSAKAWKQLGQWKQSSAMTLRRHELEWTRGTM